MEELEEIIITAEEVNSDLSDLYQNVINYWKNKFKEKCKECEDLESDKEELEYHIEVLEEKIKKIEDDRDENYRPIPIAEQLDISERDFL